MRLLSNRRLVALLMGMLTLALAIVLLIAGDFLGPRSMAMRQWWRGGPQTREALIVRQRESCPDAAFILPADGFIGLLYGDPRGPYSAARPHQGIDIFSNTDPGASPVYAAYDGYITREPNWKSTLIQRIPQDPLQPGRQIWLYYTHMADRQGNDFIEASFPPGTDEFFVRQGTLLGYTGNYNGDALRTVWVHLHFSVVLDDGSGNYTNELDFENTIDPSPYFGRNVSYTCADGDDCAADANCIAKGGNS